VSDEDLGKDGGPGPDDGDPGRDDAGRDDAGRDDAGRGGRDEPYRRRANLGRGLGALFGDEDDDYAPLGERTQRSSRTIPVSRLCPNPYQPRRHFSEDELDSLALSIREQGVLQPILVRPDPEDDGSFQIIAGERRWRAAQRAQLHDVPVVVRELSDTDALHIAIIENVQRQDLNALEEAEGYRRLIDEFRHTQDDLAKAIGKSRSHIANMLRLLDLPETVRDLVMAGRLTAGHARALLACEDPDAAARQVVARGLNVRQTEALARRGADPQRRPRKAAGDAAAPAPSAGPAPATAAADKDPDTLALEQEMSNILGLRVTIDSEAGVHAGRITVHYQSFEQLDDVLHRLSHGSRG
jgi:ParB family chromosome partitioning protein